MEMEVFSAAFMQALVAIIIIDLVLAGDNAIVIGLAARNLPPELQKKAVFWGAIGAVVVRAVLTSVVVWLLKIPGFLVVGGLALIYIAFQLVHEDDGGASEDNVKGGTTFRAAIQTIVVADAIMGVDNVLAVAGAAHGSFLLVIIGLLVSIPIVMFGSTLILKWVERYPIIIVGGAGILGWTAAKMITSEASIAKFFVDHHEWKLALYAFCIGVIVAVPVIRKFKSKLELKWLALGFTLVWLTVFNHIDTLVKKHYFSGADLPMYAHLIDLVMWLGWIPFVIMFAKVMRTSPASANISGTQA
jgi:YjbE family integral membrane protein